MSNKIRVAILGGGCGALSAAYWLSNTPEKQASYEVTVYTQGWRLGGKCASGRDEDNRIIEHGLHMLMGWYENTFSVLKECYEALGNIPSPGKRAFSNWRSAFEPQYRITLSFKPGLFWRRWKFWNVDFPDGFGRDPGDGVGELDYMGRALQSAIHWVVQETARLLGEADREISALGPQAWPEWKPAHTQFAAQLSQLQPLPPPSSQLLFSSGTPAPGIQQQLQELQRVFKAVLDDELLNPPPGVAGDTPFLLYRLYLTLDLGLAVTIGFLTDILPHGEDGYGLINHLDFKRWLRKHGASQGSVLSPPIMGLYDLGFAYPGGDSRDPRNGRAAAGAVLRTTMRMLFTWRGAPLWKMRGGMGDIVFTPLYEVLKNRDVKFRFFHRVKALDVNAQSQVERVRFVKQAEVRSGYTPTQSVRFKDEGIWPCWPEAPDWTQIGDGNAPRDRPPFENPWDAAGEEFDLVHKAKDGFDVVVLAIPPEASRFLLSAESAAAHGNKKWAEMLRNSHAAPTISAQLWLDIPENDGRTVGVSYEDPLRSWAEMSHTLRWEWKPDETTPASCKYLCGTYRVDPRDPIPSAPDSTGPDFVERQNARARTITDQWLNDYFLPLFPGLADADGDLDRTRILQRSARANVAYSEQYVLSLPGTIQHRLPPDGSGFANLYLAGDWTKTSINAGCVEAAFESGKGAAQAIIREDP